MAHAFAGRGCLAGDKSRMGFYFRVLNELCGVFFCRAADLADRDNRFGLVIAEEGVDAVDKICPIDGIAANADASGLAETGSSGLRDRFIGQCPDRETMPTLPRL